VQGYSRSSTKSKDMSELSAKLLGPVVEVSSWHITRCHKQGPRNLYGRDGKFRPTFKSVTEKRLFSVPLLLTWCSQNAPNCTDLHLYFQKIHRGHTLEPTKLGRGKPLPRLPPLDECPPSHFFRASAAAASKHRSFSVGSQVRNLDYGLSVVSYSLNIFVRLLLVYY